MVLSSDGTNEICSASRINQHVFLFLGLAQGLFRDTFEGYCFKANMKKTSSYKNNQYIQKNFIYNFDCKQRENTPHIHYGIFIRWATFNLKNLMCDYYIWPKLYIEAMKQREFPFYQSGMDWYFSLFSNKHFLLSYMHDASRSTQTESNLLPLICGPACAYQMPVV